MKIVVDANIFITSFKKNSLTRKILMYPFIEFYSPDYLIEELEEHKEELMKKAKINKNSNFFTLRLLILLTQNTLFAVFHFSFLIL